MLTLWPLTDVQNEMKRLQQEMNQLFGRNGGEGQAVSAGSPALNIWQNDDQFVVEAELPGLELGDLEILVDNGNQLTISGERKVNDRESGTWHRREMSFGQFRRTIELPSPVDADHVFAVLKNGVLTISLPKPEKEKPRRISVKAN